MKTTTFALTLIGLTLAFGVPSQAQITSAKGFVQDLTIQGDIERRKPRVPGGSGCDDPRDLIQHPECRG